jgi:carbamoyl-phosphate synthase small subunit
MKGLELASKVSTAAPYFMVTKMLVTGFLLLDLGIKTNILRNLAKRELYKGLSFCI